MSPEQEQREVLERFAALLFQPESIQGKLESTIVRLREIQASQEERRFKIARSNVVIAGLLDAMTERLSERERASMRLVLDLFNHM